MMPLRSAHRPNHLPTLSRLRHHHYRPQPGNATRFISSHPTASHLITCHHISSHRISSHLVASHRIPSRLIAEDHGDVTRKCVHRGRGPSPARSGRADAAPLGARARGKRSRRAGGGRRRASSRAHGAGGHQGRQVGGLGEPRGDSGGMSGGGGRRRSCKSTGETLGREVRASCAEERRLSASLACATRAATAAAAVTAVAATAATAAIAASVPPVTCLLYTSPSPRDRG